MAEESSAEQRRHQIQLLFDESQRVGQSHIFEGSPQFSGGDVGGGGQQEMIELLREIRDLLVELAESGGSTDSGPVELGSE